MAASEDIRATLAQQQWEITKGHIRASISLLSAKRSTDYQFDHSLEQADSENFERFERAAENFIKEVEDNGWAE